MKPRLSVITVGVENLERSLQFYLGGIGLVTGGIVGKEFEYGAVALFDLQAGLKRGTLWGGYAGCFQNPDQHLWEVAWNPHLLPED